LLKLKTRSQYAPMSVASSQADKAVEWAQRMLSGAHDVIAGRYPRSLAIQRVPALPRSECARDPRLIRSLAWTNESAEAEVSDGR
jgi:hypothetical protein